MEHVAIKLSIEAIELEQAGAPEKMLPHLADGVRQIFQEGNLKVFSKIPGRSSIQF